MPQNDYLPFANDPAANVISQAEYAGGSLSQSQLRILGFNGGTIAESAESNKVWRQCSVGVAALAQFIANETGVNMLDDGNVANFAAWLAYAVQRTTGRLVLTAPVTNFYVATTGNDANNGLSPSTPWATLQAAWNTIQHNYYLAGNQAVVNVAAGTYGPLFASGAIQGAVSPGSIVFQGDVVSPANVTVANTNGDALTAAATQATFEGFAVTASSSSGSGVGTLAQNNALLGLNAITYGNCDLHCLSDAGSYIFWNPGSSYTIEGSAGWHMASGFLSQIQLGGVNVTITGAPNFSHSFIDCSQDSYLQANQVRYIGAGAVTGKRYNAETNGVIGVSIGLVGGPPGGYNYFPGTIAGTPLTANDPSWSVATDLQGTYGGWYIANYATTALPLAPDMRERPSRLPPPSSRYRNLGARLNGLREPMRAAGIITDKTGK